MSQTIKTADVTINTKHVILAVLQNVFAAVLGFIGSRACVQSVAAPFGIAVVAAAPRVFTPAAVLGAALGYFIPSGHFSAFKYIAALSAIAAIKYMLCSIKNLSQNKFVLSVACILSLMLTNVIISSRDTYSLIIGFCESILAGAAVFFFCDTINVLNQSSKSPDSLKVCSIIISVNLLLLGLYGVVFFDVSIGRLFASVFLLSAARYGRAPTGAVCAVSVALSVALHSLDFANGALAFCVAGLFAGIFAALGKIACCIAYLLTFILSSILFKNGEISLILTSEAVFAASVFLVLPRSFSKSLAKFLSPLSVKASQVGKCNALTMRLMFASSALKDVSQTVDTVARELSKINCPDFDGVIDSVKDKTCKGCSNFARCWDGGRQKTIDFTAKMAGNIQSNTEDISPDEFKALCLRREEFENNFKDAYRSFYKKLGEEDRLEQVRNVVSDQFDAVGQMLNSLADEFTNDEVYDSLLADKIACALREMGIIVNDCGCRTDKFGRMTVEIRVVEKSQTVFNRMHILHRIESVCERDFENPCIFSTNSEVLITLSEKALYTVDTSVKQINSNHNAVCGDAYSCFYDGKGHYVMLLSDGMGNGGRAAVDGAMATNVLTRLIKAGFGWDCSLKILNSSMLFKSTDESLATVDAVCIDLFTGKTELFKAGAAPTLVRRSGRTGKAQSTSLPAGILREIGFDKATITLKHKDIALMLSDGAVADGTDWICAILEDFEGTADELSNKIATDAYLRRHNGKNDDITVIATILHKAV